MSKLYSFLVESKDKSLTYSVKDPSKLNDSQRHDVCQLCQQLGKDHIEYDKKLDIVAYNDQLTFPDGAYEKRILKKSGVTFQKFFVCECDGHIVGLIHYREYQDSYNEYHGKYGWFPTIVVNPSYRQRGIGSKLMELAKSWIKKNRPSIMVFLGVSCNNPGGLALYSKYGFKPVHQTMVCKL